ncbi:MAG: trehalose-6-phosphate synthase [Caulobacteraceae bacterium]|nr:trehalose-6-phosphate synthase [Caulobacteraceae bacterium]
MGRLVVVSNRVSLSGGSPGGMAVALTGALKESGGFWFGWSGERTERFTGAIRTQRIGDVDVATIDLEEADYQEYYNGYANGALWPLFHYRIDLTAYDRSYGVGYERVNRRFADALAPLLRPDDLIWVHDYHLIPLGQELRRRGITNPIGFFLHIPWPAPELLTTLPRHRQLVEALFAYDLVGFQTDEWLRAFEDYVMREAGGRRGGGRVSAFGRSVVAQAFPIGLDVEEFLALCETEAAIRSYDRMAAHSVFRAMMIGVERLDYAKGLEERLLGYEQFLADNPELAGKVFYLQIAPLSREEVDAYQQVRARIWSLAGRINADWGDIDFAPMRCLTQNYSRAQLAGVYRAARVGLVTPLRDGMNLVAKEYVAAQDPEDPGVLILSRFAGAAREMTEAVIVNPFSREELAEAMRRALTMELRERRRRWEALMSGLRENDVNVWRDSFVVALRAAADPSFRHSEQPRLPRTVSVGDDGEEAASPPAAAAGREAQARRI